MCNILQFYNWQTYYEFVLSSVYLRQTMLVGWLISTNIISV